MWKTGEVKIPLTGKDSHKINVGPSGGDLYTIGTKGISKGDFDAWVEEGDTINWDAFNGFYVPATLKERKEEFPYGDLPRFFIYSGNDTNFIKWSTKRRIEDFDWYPQKPMIVDFTEARIFELLLNSNYKIEMSLGKNIYYLNLCGNLDNYIIKKCDELDILRFYPEYKNDITSYKLPVFEAFKKIKKVYIKVPINNPPFDCKSLLQFPYIEDLSLIGNMTNLQALKELKHLKEIGLWNIKDLSNFPHLNNFTNLEWFVAVNIEETAGRRFREEMKVLKKKQKYKYVSICNLRNTSWFETNADLPFATWEKNERKATSIYKNCLKKVEEAETEDNIKDAVIEYTEIMNKLDNIETIERDDIYIALKRIMDNSKIKIEEDKWLLWFDETRDF